MILMFPMYPVLSMLGLHPEYPFSLLFIGAYCVVICTVTVINEINETVLLSLFI